MLKKDKYPLDESCEFFDYCAGEEGENRKDCGYCPLHPRAARAFSLRVSLQALLTVLITFLLGALAAAIFGH